jgi:multidrug resistance efflux pump
MFGVCAAAHADDLNKNPFVSLYRSRLTVAERAVVSQQNSVNFEFSKWKRLDGLAKSGAVPEKEASDQETRYRIAEKKLEIARLKLDSAIALLQIAKSRVEAGQSVDVCSAQD